MSDGARGGTRAIRRAIQRRMCGSGSGARTGGVLEAVMIGVDVARPGIGTM
jgi:hypothetical protein